METLLLAENIAFLRHQKGITQEDLANFLGVTKASVSKWENKQSFPDILLLPKLASFFDVTVDFLLGYEPQLSKEQIQTLYHQLAADFATSSFEDVIAHCQQLIKKYYCCYPFLLQMVVLYLNHFMMANTHQRQIELLTEASDLCTHIESQCHNGTISNDAAILHANIYLLLQRPQDVIDTLEDRLSPLALTNSTGSILIQAYQMTQNQYEADRFTQITLYVNLISIIIFSTNYLEIQSNNQERCQTIIDRTEQFLALFDLKYLHPNATLQFYYAVSIFYCQHKQYEKGLRYLENYVHHYCYIIKHNLFSLHSDSYFPLLDTWFQQLPLGANAPRDLALVHNSVIESLQHPAFSELTTQNRFQQLFALLKNI